MDVEPKYTHRLLSTSVDPVTDTTDDQFILSLDAFIRSIGVRRTAPFAMFLGAGASTSSGIPSARMCIWEWKRQIFLTNNPGLEEQFAELSLDGVRRRIQRWLDRQGVYPPENAPEEYGFYIRQCFPITNDRRAYFAELIRHATPHIGYRLLCYLAEADLVRSVWSPNFDNLPARAAANFKLSPIEVGIDTQGRIARGPAKGELLCVSMHGDYRYDQLKNTPEELQLQEARLRAALIAELRDTSLVVSGYSGRDQSLMDALRDAYVQPGSGVLYWCGFSAGDPPAHITALIHHVRSHGRQAYYVPTLGFDDVLTRISLHCLQGTARQSVLKAMEEFAPEDKLTREPWQVPKYEATTLIKSNSFAIECPSEMLRFDLKEWPETGTVWAYIRERTRGRAIAAVPFKGNVFALGLIDAIKDAFGNNIKGPVERTPVGPKDLAYEDTAIVSLMREALTRSMAETANLRTDGQHELWKPAPREDQRQCRPGYVAFDSVYLYLRRIAGTQYLALMPSIKVLDKAGAEAPLDIGNPIKLAILGYQHNKPFNRAVMDWRSILFPQDHEAVYEFPRDCGSGFRFKIRRSPVFGEIGLPQGGKVTKIPAKLEPLVKYRGFQLTEPDLLFSNKAGNALIRSPHPIRGIVENRPFDYPLTARGFFTGLRLGVICPATEAKALHRYLHNANHTLAPTRSEQDYLVNYPGFHSAYGIPIEFPQPGEAGWFACPEPSSLDPQTNALEIAEHINRGIETLQASFAPHVVMIFYPSRWREFRGYRTDVERFDVHDFVKAFCVQRGIATQFLNEETFSDAYQCRVWWWLSLALYAKSMRTPWVLNSLAEETAFVGLGFSVDPVAEKGRHVVLGCSHIYSGKGEGLQYRLTKIETPVFYGKNPFMSKDDARRTGETIRQLFFDARLKLPERVVLHKRTHFTKDEREGLADGLTGVKHIDMIEIQIDNALRYVASVQTSDGSFNDDNYPVRRGTAMKLEDFTALMWVHGATTALHPSLKYFQGKRRIPAPLTVRRHAGRTDLQRIAEEILGLSKMNWNTFDLYTKLPATLHSSNEIARIGSLLQRFGASSYDYRLFM
jgi:hypothetical protein